jgi:hypothetical protein
MLPTSQTKSYKTSSKVKAAAELERRRRMKMRAAMLPTDWRERIPALFAAYFWYPFSDPHAAVWDWANAIGAASDPRPLTAFWSRGRGKSTTAEAVAADLGIRKARTYCMYVCGTQDQADKHVQTVARMLEQNAVAQYAPDIGKPRLSQNGNRSWNRQIVQTATGFTIESIGLNKAVRGQKIDWARPDLIILDDVDEKHDTELTTRKKEEILSDSILPAGATNAAVIFMQNLIHSNSIASRLAKAPGSAGAADYLMERLISGPFPAVEGLKYELQPSGNVYRWAITGGRSLWAGFDLAICQAELNRVGPTAYERESQHDVNNDDPNALMSSEDFDRTRATEHPDLVQVAVAVDPPGGATECGIVAGGKALIDGDWHGYVLEDNSQPAGVPPNTWALEVLKTYYRTRADMIYIEKNFGGDMVANTIRQVKWLDDDGNVIVDGARVAIVEVSASRGKAVRAQPIATAFQQGRCHHVGMFSTLEREWRQFVPGVTKESPNRLDAEVWLFTGLGLVDDGNLLLFGGNE